MKLNIVSIALIGILLVATYLGAYAPDIASEIGSNFGKNSPTIILIIVIALSILLFIFVLIALLNLRSKDRKAPNLYHVLLFVTIIMGLLVSAWAQFVLWVWN